MENDKKSLENEHGSRTTGLPLGNLSIFDGEQYFLYLYRKSEKMALAVYMITDFFPDNDPIKAGMRTSVVSLIEMSLSMNSSFLPDRKKILSNIVKQCLQLISYSQIASFAGIESLMNHQILKAELESCISTIEEKEAPYKVGKDFILSPDFMKEDPEGGLIRKMEQGVSSSTVSSLSHSVHRSADSINKYNGLIKDNKSSHPVAQIPRRIHNDQEGNKKNKNNRKDIIMNTIRQNGGELSIKDIARGIKGCSEKTIQRELLSMVEEGLLNKTGERRWSRYSIVS